MLSFLKKLFQKKSKKSVSSIMETINPGEFISVRFIDPNRIGIVDPSKRLSKRFDQEDISLRIITGTLTRKFSDLGMQFIEIQATKVIDGHKKERLYTFMIDELEEAKILK